MCGIFILLQKLLFLPDAVIRHDHDEWETKDKQVVLSSAVKESFIIKCDFLNVLSFLGVQLFIYKG